MDEHGIDYARKAGQRIWELEAEVKQLRDLIRRIDLVTIWDCASDGRALQEEVEEVLGSGDKAPQHTTERKMAESEDLIKRVSALQHIAERLARVDELEARVERLRAAGQTVLSSWDRRSGGDREKLKHGTTSQGEEIAFWSPSAAMVDSEAIANLRNTLQGDK